MLPSFDTLTSLRYGLSYHPRFRLLLCDHTKQALDVTYTPAQKPLQNHLTSCQHSCSIQQALDFVRTYSIPTPNENVSLPAGPLVCLSFLGEPVDGYVCSTCGLGFSRTGGPKSKDPHKGIRDHFHTHHLSSWDLSSIKDVRLQRWYVLDKKNRYGSLQRPGQPQTFFSPWVIIESGSSPSFEHRMADFNSLLPIVPPSEPSVVDDRDVSAIVERMGWKRFANHATMQQHLQLLAETASSGAEGQDLDVHLLQRWCEYYVHFIDKQLEHVPTNFLFTLVTISQ